MTTTRKKRRLYKDIASELTRTIIYLNELLQEAKNHPHVAVTITSPVFTSQIYRLGIEVTKVTGHEVPLYIDLQPDDK